VDRLVDETRLCHTGRRARVSSAFAHLGEEDCLRGTRGSGTIFFAWCNLQCVFCQNWETSSEGEGHEVDAKTLAAMMLELQARGCHNINFVTPEHVVPQVLESLPYAIEGGLRVPLVYNTSAYDSLHGLQLMEDVVDIYMPDFKYWDPHKCARFLRAKDYAERARAAIREMHRQVGPLEIDQNGLARRGVLVRHLVMPGDPDDTEAILHWLADEVDPRTYVNVMAQYHPAGLVTRRPDKYPSLARRPSINQLNRARELASRLGLRLDQPRSLGLRLLWD